MKGMKINKALVVFNKPLHQIHILEQKNPHFLGLFKEKHPTTKKWKPVYEQHRRTLEGIHRTLSLIGIATDTIYRKRLKKIGAYDLVITVGGDGTFLETAHYCDKQTLLGVNAAPMDSTGALCRARLDNFLSILIDLMTGERKPIQIARLRLKVGRKTHPFYPVNEILFANKTPAGTSRYIIQVGAKREEQKSSGVWIATPTGSTAAIRSAGGKPIPLTKECLQFAVRELFREKGVKYQLLRGIVPKGKSLKLFPTMRQAALYLDGTHICIPVPYGEKVEIFSNGKPLKAVL